MAIEATTPSPPSRRFLRAYLVMWAIVGISAFAYLIVLLARPDLITLYPGPPMIGSPDSNEGQRAMSRALADVQALRDGLQQAQLDISQLKAEFENQDGQGKQLAQRLTAIEVRLASASEAADLKVAEAATPAQTAQADVISPVRRPADATTETPAATSTASAVAPKLINGAGESEAARIETGSVEPAPATAKAAATEPVIFGPAVVKPAQRELGVKLGSGTSVDALRLSWSLLAERHGDTLRSLEPRYTEGRSDSTPYELVAGPVKNAADGRRICATMKKRGIACEVGAYTGNAL